MENILTGIIKTYLTDKNYGFIKGDDHKDYFFHKSSIKKDDLEKISDGALVSFEQKATPKGYNAINISINSKTNANYLIPDEVYVSKHTHIKGWENICVSDWIVHGTSESSPDEAKQDMIDGAIALDANALLEMEYYKTTGSEPGTGSGTYYYTIHNFKGRLTNIGKKSLNGEYSKDELCTINEDAKKLKQQLRKKTRRSTNLRLFFWIIMLLITVLSWVVSGNILFPIGLLFLAYILSHATDYDSWLEED